MQQSLAQIALIVRGYDEAIAWFTEKLGFTLVADEYQPEQDKRWVLVAPPGAGDNAFTLLLPSAALSNDALHRRNFGAAPPAPRRRSRRPLSVTRRANASCSALAITP